MIFAVAIVFDFHVCLAFMTKNIDSLNKLLTQIGKRKVINRKMNNIKFHIYFYGLNNIQIKAFYNVTCGIPRTKKHTHTLCAVTYIGLLTI